MDFLEFNILDILDVICVAFLLFQLYKLIKGTVAIRIFIGIAAIYLLWKLVEALQMDLLSEILGQFIGVGVLAVIIVFQQELRRFFEHLRKMWKEVQETDDKSKEEYFHEYIIK